MEEGHGEVRGDPEGSTLGGVGREVQRKREGAGAGLGEMSSA